MMGDTSRVLVELHLPDVVRRRGFNVWPLAASLWSGWLWRAAESPRGRRAGPMNAG